jgi:hypothetical protein
MKHLPKALDRNGDLWVPTATKHLVFRALKDARQALESTQGLQASPPQGRAFQIDHAEQLKSLEMVEQLLGLDQFDRALPPVHEQLGEPAPQQARLLRNLFKLSPV